MNHILQKGKNIFNRYFGFFSLAVFLLWMKTYFSQLTKFKLGVEGTFQQFLLFLNPLGSSLLCLGLALFFKGRTKYVWLLGIYFFLSVLLYSNILYYRFFSDYITLPTLIQTQNAGKIGGSVVSLLKSYDFLFFIDFILLLVLGSFRFVTLEMKDLKRRKVSDVYSLSIAIICANLGLAKLDRPQLFDRNYVIKYIGLYN